MAASGYEQTKTATLRDVRFAPKSRHQRLDVCYSAENVCLTLNSGRNRGIGFSSAPNSDIDALYNAPCGRISGIDTWSLGQTTSPAPAGHSF